MNIIINYVLLEMTRFVGLVTLKLGFTHQLDFGLELGCTLASLCFGLWASVGLRASDGLHYT